MKILILTPRYYPEQFKITQIAQYLAKENEVDVICNIPDYHLGKYYKGYSLFKNRKQVINNVNVYRLPTTPRGKTLIGLFFSYLSLYISGLFKANFIKKKYDVVLNYQLSPVHIGLIGLKIAKKLHIPCLTYIFDYWPDSLVAGKSNINKSNIIYKIVKKQSEKVYKNSDYIWISSLGFKNKLLALGINENKIQYVPNFGDDILKKSLLINNEKFISLIDNQKYKILYAGNIGKVQRLDVLVKIANKAKQTNDKSFVFVLVGNGNYKMELLKDIKKDELDDYFIIYDEQPLELMPTIYSLCDSFYFALDKSLSFTLPAKLCSYFAFNKPILAYAFNQCKDILKLYNGTVFIDDKKFYDSVSYLISNHREIVENIDTNFYMNNFSKEIIFNKINQLLKNIVSQVKSR